MRFEETLIPGVFIVTRTPNFDERGSFSRFYCEKEFNSVGINEKFVQMNFCTNKKKGTLRGLHCQKKEYAEDKLVSCVNGSIFDVCVDMRFNSPTYCKYVSCVLSAENGKMLYIPKGFAHGYLTLEDNSNLIYLMSEFYVPDSAYGYRYDDPVFNIEWPFTEELIISKKDLQWPILT